MESVEGLLALMKEYGSGLVMLVILVILLNKVIDVIIPYFLKIVYKLIDKDPQKTYKADYANKLVTAGLIDDILGLLLHSSGADRAYIFEYHNGGKSINNVNFQKLSNTHEVVNRGISTTIQGLQNLPVGMFARISRMIAKHEKVLVADVCDLKDVDESLHYFCMDRKAKSLYIHGIYDAHDLPIGFVGIEYLKQNHEMSRDELDELQSCADKIGGLLMGNK